MTPTRLVTALAVAAALVGCSGDPEPRVAPTEAPSVSASPSSTPDPTPTEAAELDPEQTVRAWIEAQNVALTTGDFRRLQSLSSPDLHDLR